MQSHKTQLASITLIALFLLLTACGTTVPAKYYLLTPAGGGATGASGKQLLISVGPVTLPAYLDRSQIVTRSGNAELDLADGQRWAEPLQQNFSRVLAEDLYGLLGAGKVIVWPAREPAAVDYRVAVDVERFDCNDQGEAILTASWSIYGGNTPGLLEAQHSEYKVAVAPPEAGYPEKVAALSRTISLFSRDILKTINALERSR